MSLRYGLLLIFSVLILTICPAAAWEDNFQDEDLSDWTLGGTIDGFSLYNDNATHPTSDSVYMRFDNSFYPSGYVNNDNIVPVDYVSFTVRYVKWNKYSSCDWGLKIMNEFGGLVCEIPLKNQYSSLVEYPNLCYRYEIIKDGFDYKLYRDGVYLATYTGNGDIDVGKIGFYADTNNVNSYVKLKFDDISSASTLGCDPDINNAYTNFFVTYGIKYKWLSPDSTYQIKIVDTSDSEVVHTTTVDNYAGSLGWDLSDTLGTNYSLYKFELTKDGITDAVQFFSYTDIQDYGTVQFDAEAYVLNEEASIAWNLVGDDMSTYNYELEIIDVNGVSIDTYELTDSSGTWDYTFEDIDDGTYFVLMSRTNKATTIEELLSFDYCQITESVVISGNTYLFNGTVADNADVTILQSSTYSNTTSDGSGAYSQTDLSDGVSTTLSASRTGESSEEFTFTPVTSGVLDIDLILFPDNMTDYWGENDSAAYGLVYDLPYHRPMDGATVTISNDTWSDTTTTSSTGFYIFHNLTDASDYTINATMTRCTPSSDYTITMSGNTRKDIGLNALYTVTIQAEDSATSSPILDFTAVFDDVAYESSAAGKVTLDAEAGIYYLIVGSDGYNSYASNAAILGDTTITADLVSQTSTSSSSGTLTGSFTEPHTAEFIYLSYIMTRYPGVDVTVYEGPQEEVIVDGIPSEDAVEVASMATGDTGAVVFEMNKTDMYTLYAVSEDPEFTKITSLAPQDSRYYIFIGTNPFSSDSDGPVDNIYYGVVGTKLSLDTAQINGTFQDTSNSTVLAEWWVEDKNGTQLYYDSTTDNAFNWSTTVDVDDNETYYVYFEIDTGSLSEPKLITKTFNFYHTVHPAFDLGFGEQWHYHVVTAFIIVLIAGLFSVANGHLGLIVATILGWIFVWIGYIEPSITSGLAMTFATMVAGMMYIRRQERF